MPGPPRKPTVIKASEGNPGKRRLNTAELAEKPKAPPCPAWLNKGARKQWYHLTKLLMRSGVLREVDQVQLASLCDACATLVDARRALEQLPEKARLIVQTPNGGYMQNPLISILNTQKYIITRIAAEFGLTPAARARLFLIEEGPEAGAELDDMLDAPALGRNEEDDADLTIQ